ncbi:endonuclease V [Acinetobacter bereziniae]|uniref:endonuclease V n=1 Tax=Acinetobacter bereziniae TaxID=106648 RepID=UPI0021CD7F7D|nr:endonuclease V [Acinetobacter bereziniae]MCU4536203.1 endonuclease V [Acinetobacter bereziniae]
MILAIDVAYSGTSAQVAGGIFDAWEATDLFKQYRISLDHIMDYESGQFYKRELPCIQALMAQITEHIDMIIIDGYVHLGNEQKAGLGQYLYEALMLKVPVIGVAKNQFTGTPKDCEILRGQSLQPLYISAVGIELELAKQYVKSMYGKYRIPKLLKDVDRLSKMP